MATNAQEMRKNQNRSGGQSWDQEEEKPKQKTLDEFLGDKK